MTPKRKKVLKGFDYLHCDDFAAFLEEMAAKGWHFKEWGAGLIFEQGQPRRDTYAVEVFSEATEYDTRPEPQTEEFAAYCEAAGWELVDAKRKFCIFRKVRPDAVEILPPEERLQNIAKEEQKQIWQKLAMSGTFTVLQIFQFTGSGFVNRIFSNGLLFVALMWLVLFLAALGRCIHFYLWKRASRKCLAAGGSVWFGKSKRVFAFLGGWYGWLTGGALGAYMVGLLFAGEYLILTYIGGTLGLLVLMGYLIAKFRPDALTNQIIQVIGSLLIVIAMMGLLMGMLFTEEKMPVQIEDIPLLYTDIGGEAGELEDVTLDGAESIFGSAMRCWLYYEDAHIYYQVYETEHQWILDKMWNEEMERKYNKNGTDCTDLWEAETAVCTLPGYYRVRYSDAILYLNLPEDVELTKLQADIIRTTLHESR